MLEITDDEIAGLPDDDDEIAFVKFERIVRLRYEDAASNYQQDELPATPRAEYMNLVAAAAKHCGISALAEWEEETGKSNAYQLFSSFTADVDRTTLQIRLRNKKQEKRASVALDAATKLKMRHHLAQVRNLIEMSPLSDDKKDALYKCIGALELEIERNRTKLQAFYDLFVQSCTVAADGAKAAEPFIRAVERLGAALGIAQAAERSAKLPSPDQQQKLPAPQTKRIAGPKTRKLGIEPDRNGFDKSIDDEIPF